MKDTVPNGVERFSAMLEHERIHNGLTGWRCSVMPGKDQEVLIDDLANEAADMMQVYLDGKCTDITGTRL